MTGLLQSALRRVEALSPAEQDAIGAEQLERARAAAARIREIQMRSKPDPESLTAHDYIDHDRP